MSEVAGFETERLHLIHRDWPDRLHLLIRSHHGLDDLLAQENAALRDQLATVGPAVPERPGESTKPSPVLPRDDEMDRALGFLEKLLRRFMSLLREDTGKPI